MLIIAWESLVKNIDRLEAQERLATYDAMLLANPHVPDAERQRVVVSWEQQAASPRTWLTRQIAGLTRMIGRAFGGDAVQVEEGHAER